MRPFPAALVQIHYHDRPGGVRQVIERYSAFFRGRAGEQSSNYLICAASPGGCCCGMTVIDLPQAGYHRFRSVSAFTHTTDMLAERLLDLLGGLSKNVPVAVIGHNLALGKNPALSAAFTRCALKLGGTEYRFFSVLHDLLYDGREPLPRLRTTTGRESVIPDADLFSVGAPVHFIVPSAVTARITSLGRRELSTVPNPFEVPAEASKCTTAAANKSLKPDRGADNREKTLHVKRMLSGYAMKNGLVFDRSLPLYCYPSRMIYRKNLFEAMLLANVLLGGTLVTGGSGAHRIDVERMATARFLSKRYGFSFIPDALTAYSQIDAYGSTGEPFEPLLLACDAAVCTSVSEGFGYALFTPWMYGKQVLGRMPSGASLLPGMVMPGHYTRLPVPVRWISIEQTYTRLARAYTKVFNKRFQSLQRFSADVIIDETIDFAVLSPAQQVELLRRVAENRADRAALVSHLGKPLSGWPGLGRFGMRQQACVRDNRRIVAAWGTDGFRRTFENCLSRIPCKPRDRWWYRRVRARFAVPSGFRPFFEP